MGKFILAFKHKIGTLLTPLHKISFSLLEHNRTTITQSVHSSRGFSLNRSFSWSALSLTQPKKLFVVKVRG